MAAPVWIDGYGTNISLKGEFDIGAVRYLNMIGKNLDVEINHEEDVVSLWCSTYDLARQLLRLLIDVFKRAGYAVNSYYPYSFTAAASNFVN